MSDTGEFIPLEPDTPAAKMAAQHEADMHDAELPMERRIAAANNYRELTCTFEEEYGVTADGEHYLSRSSSGLCYSGPEDYVGYYDF